MRSPEADITRLRHMLDYTRKALAFTKGKNRPDLDNDEVLALAVIHLIEIIGGAAGSISDEFQAQHPEIPWSLITGTRNRLAHGYIDVDLDIIWAIVQKNLPELAQKLHKILA